MGKINAKIFSIKNGYTARNNLNGIRIVSKKYNLLVMEDYLPVIGEVDGNVVLISDNEEELLENIKGYYRHSHNEFELLVSEEKVGKKL